MRFIPLLPSPPVFLPRGQGREFGAATMSANNSARDKKAREKETRVMRAQVK